MAGYIVTGKLGTGKSLFAVWKMREGLNHGRRVATNMTIFMDRMVRAKARNTVGFKLPMRPSAWDLDQLPPGNPDFERGLPRFDENKNGLLVLDECGSWLNARSWNEKGRAELLQWFIHARKRGWDVYLLVQDIEMVDKQAVRMVAEHVIECKRADRLTIPLIGPLIKTLLPFKLPVPRAHLAITHYGDSLSDMVTDRTPYRASDLLVAYDTREAFHAVENDFDREGVSQFLSPWLTAGRHLPGSRARERWRKLVRERLEWSWAVSAAAGVVAIVAAGLATFSYHTGLSRVEAAEQMIREARAVREVSQQPVGVSPLDIYIEGDQGEAEGAAPEPVSEPEPAPVVPDACPGFDGLKLVGAISMAGKTAYIADGGEEGGSRMLTHESVKPFVLVPGGSCFVEVQGEGCRIALSC